MCWYSTVKNPITLKSAFSAFPSLNLIYSWMELTEWVLASKNQNEFLHNISITFTTYYVSTTQIICRGFIKYLQSVFIKYAIIHIHQNQRTDTGENLWDGNRELRKHFCWNELYTPMWLTQKQFSCCQYSCLWSQPNNHTLLPKKKKTFIVWHQGFAISLSQFQSSYFKF